MIEFVTQPVNNGKITIDLPCLATPFEQLLEGKSEIIVDGVRQELPEKVVEPVIRTIRECEDFERRGYSVDCSVFGALVMGGLYTPQDDETYRRRLERDFIFGRYLTREEAFGITPKIELVSFVCCVGKRVIPRHTAVKLPGIPNLYIQKLSHGYPIAISGTIDSCRLLEADTAASVDLLTATLGEELVLYYKKGIQSAKPVARYHGRSEIDDQ